MVILIGCFGGGLFGEIAQSSIFCGVDLQLVELLVLRPLPPPAYGSGKRGGGRKAHCWNMGKAKAVCKHGVFFGYCPKVHAIVKHDAPTTFKIC